VISGCEEAGEGLRGDGVGDTSAGEEGGEEVG
jgi:hypothetical protein